MEESTKELRKRDRIELRFIEDASGSGIGGLLDKGRYGSIGQDDDGKVAVRFLGAEPVEYVDAIEVWHHEIKEDRVGLEERETFHPAGTVRC